MDHTEAVGLMATERYFLDELSPEMREAFEEHFFECQECALDVRTTSALVDEAKRQMAASSMPSPAAARGKFPSVRRDWFSWWKPAFALPAFALLLLVVGYQNLATIPSLRSAALQPRLAPWTTLHVGTRDGSALPVTASQKSGAVVLVDIADTSQYSSFAFALQDPHGKQFWTATIPAAAQQEGQQTLSLLIPGMGLQPGLYTLTISGNTTEGNRNQLDRRVLDIRIAE